MATNPEQMQNDQKSVVVFKKRSISDLGILLQRSAELLFNNPRAMRRCTDLSATPSICAVSLTENASLFMLFDSVSAGIDAGAGV